MVFEDESVENEKRYYLINKSYFIFIVYKKDFIPRSVVSFIALWFVFFEK